MIYFLLLLCATFSVRAAQMSPTEAIQIDQTTVSQQLTPAALINAIMKDDEKMVAELLAAGIKPSTQVRDQNNQWSTPLLYALLMMPLNPNIIVRLVEADKNYAGSLLFKFISDNQWKNRSRAYILIKAGANVNIGGEYDSTLHNAIPDREMVSMLLAAEANPNEQNYEETALNYAILRQDLASAKLLLRGGANPNLADEFNGFPIQLALKNHDLEMLQLLLQYGADPNTIMPDLDDEQNYETPLTWAAKNKDLEIIAILLLHKANPNIRNSQGMTIAHIALSYPELSNLISIPSQVLQASCNKPQGEIANIIAKKLTAEAKQTTGLHANNSLNQTLNESISVPESQECKATLDILRGNTNHEIPNLNLQDTEGNTPLLLAVMNDRPSIRIVKRLIELGSPINAKNNKQRTALMEAIGNPRIVETLIRAGANINLQDNKGDTALILAAKNNDPYSLELLLQAGADPNIINGENKTILNYIKMQKNDSRMSYVAKSIIQKARAALLKAAITDNVQEIEYYIEKIDIHDGDENGWTALMNAAANGSIAALDLLINKGAFVDMRDKDGGTAVMKAAQYGQVEALKKLIQQGANINIADDCGNTALHLAASSNQPLAMLELLRAGANIDEKFTTIIKDKPQMMRIIKEQYKK